MVIATLTLLAFLFFGGAGGGWVGFAHKEVSKSVSDSSRAKAAKNVLKQMQDVVDGHGKHILKLREELSAVERNYDSTAEDYRKVYRKLDAAWRESENRLVELRIELLQHMSPEEWRDLCDRVKTDMDEARAKAEEKAEKEARKRAA